ncbi:MAG: hypothetical protein WBD61_10235 [Desulfobulbales bacterium]|jgi:5-methylthioadenosine/S-adenosylhomocysteine deaminase
MSHSVYKADLLVSGRYLYLQNQDKIIVRGIAVAILQDTIVETGLGSELAAKYPEAERLATEHGLIMPGLINTQPMQPWHVSSVT